MKTSRNQMIVIGVLIIASIIFLALILSSFYFFKEPPKITLLPDNDPFESSQKTSYPWHRNITVTIFWVGEPATPDNEYISNSQSAWDDRWVKDFGGVDDPADRRGYYPFAFIPKENPFYFALPYDDLEDGVRKSNVVKVYWNGERDWTEKESLCKNRWIRITKRDRVAYAQWEDVGPFETDNIDYVFGNKSPKNRFGARAGLDVSPAVRDYLGLEDIDKVDWKFVDASEVPEGPWRNIVTVSGINWN